MKIRRYPSLAYTTLFNPLTGFFARIEDKGHPEPFWSPFGPELLDVSITSYCDRMCDFCYRHAHIGGKHMPLEDYQRLIDIASTVGVYQIALVVCSVN
ncbi:MAG TPA: radical SAM/SPASM domain-containing protein, partial [Holosporales bacterium]|nr:radical SAM/SPASM domain-containing protein [Holosporales bacterium]